MWRTGQIYTRMVVGWDENWRLNTAHKSYQGSVLSSEGNTKETLTSTEACWGSLKVSSQTRKRKKFSLDLSKYQINSVCTLRTFLVSLNHQSSLWFFRVISLEVSWWEVLCNKAILFWKKNWVLVYKCEKICVCMCVYTYMYKYILSLVIIECLTGLLCKHSI